MNKRSKKTLPIFISIAAIAAVVIAASVVRRSSVVGGLSVNVNSSKPSNEQDDSQTTLISPSEIEQAVLSEYPGLTSSRVKDIDTKDIESYLNSNPYIESSQVAISVGGRVIANVTSRRPIARIYCDGISFFIDRQGRCFPAKRTGNSDVIVANGNFLTPLPKEPDSLDISKLEYDSVFHSHPLVSIWKLALYLDNTENGYSHLFDQIFIDSNGELILQPKFGNHDIVIGDTLNLDDKFRRLKKFYAKGLPHAGYDSYRRVNLKYRDQVVCTKRSSHSESTEGKQKNTGN